MALTGDAKSEYMKKYRQDRKEEKQAILNELETYKARDEAKQYFPGEFSTCVDLWKIYKGLDPKADPNKKPKVGVEFINPCDQSEEFFGRSLTFEEWLEQRQIYRGDMWLFMHLVGRGRWSEQAHKPIADFFVKKNNSDLRFGYTQSEMQAVLFSQDTQHARLLLYPRGNRKSTINLIDAAQWIINFPDIVILICTNVKTLGKAFVKELRSYFTIKDYRRPTKFQILFPEYCIPEDKGKKSGDVREFRCPMARLGLKDATISFTSMESGTAGVRADVIKFDDPVDELNYRQVEQRIAVRQKYDANLELLVGNTGFWDAVGTRYTDGSREDTPEGPEPDLYGTIINRYYGTDKLKKLIASAWTVLSEFEATPLKEIERHMVTLLFPTLPCVCGNADNKESSSKCKSCGAYLEQSPGCFDSLVEKCRKNEMWFRCQQLNEPAAEIEEEEEYINTFTVENIRAQQVDFSLAPGIGRKYLFVDTAMTAGRKSDYSAFVVLLVQDRHEKEPLVWFLEIRAERYNDMEVASIIGELMQKWDCGAYVEEIPGTGLSFKNEVARQVMIRGCSHLPFQWFTPDQQPAAKETRIRGLQLLHERGLLRYVVGGWIDKMVKQLIDYRGHRTRKNYKGGRKDDIPDAMAYVYKVLPYISGYSTEEQKAEQERQETQAKLRAMHDRIFGNASPQYRPAPTPEAPSEDDGIRGTFGIPFGPRYK